MKDLKNQTISDSQRLTETDKPNDDHRKSSPLSSPIQWIRMLSRKLHPSFVLGVVLVYGLSQGFSIAFFKVVSDYYWKDVQNVQPSAAQLFVGLYSIPWVMKPLWGLMTDVFPVKGYLRRPYFVVAGVIGVFSSVMVAAGGQLVVVVALCCLMGIMTGLAIADVTIDACIARNSIEFRSLATDMQSLGGVCSSVGALVGYSTSGVFVHLLGAQESMALLSISPAAMIFLGFVIHEPREEVRGGNKKTARGKLREAVKGMYTTIQIPQVWKPSLYMYFSLALSISTHEGQFYWYTDSEAGPAFSQEFVGIIYAVGAMASIVGVIIYHRILRDYPFRALLFFAQLLYTTSGMLDIIFVLRWNLAMGIPDYLFVVTEECVSRIINRLRWMPMMVLSSQLCPLGIEGTFFALLMCIDSLGGLTAKWGGGMILHSLGVSRTDFSNLWVALLIRNVLRFLTLGLVFLVPNARASEALIPVDVENENREDMLEIVPLKENTDV